MNATALENQMTTMIRKADTEMLLTMERESMKKLREGASDEDAIYTVLGYIGEELETRGYELCPFCDTWSQDHECK